MNTEVIKIDVKKPDKQAIKRAAAVVEKGGLVAFPTETVYGLAADHANEEAIQRLYDVKKRPRNKPFTVHISKHEDLIKLSCEVTIFSEHLMEEFWPGPLTLIFGAKSGGKIGVRMPSNRIALDFISACKNPIVAPSANTSGKRPPRKAGDVLEDLDGKIELVLDGGPTEIGAESTVVDVSVFPCRVLREGAIDSVRIADVGRKLHFT